ncbi:peptidylprolyl isomerase [Nakamurella sp.]|uniref:peptidylprolyl isomerase n=1 Tax=Nakamurella sp. TaxID=1869182 RepID=UPI003B3A18B1
MTTRVGQTRRTTTGAAAAALLIGLLAACSGPPAATGTGAAPATATAASTAPAGTTGAAGYGTGACAPVAGAATPVLEFPDAFADCLDPGKAYTATITTSEGPVVVQLDTDRTPIAANNFVNLARSGYYDDTSLFRTEARTGIIQGGSPHTQNNRDPGPGYTIPDEGLPFSTADYAPGVIAMANSGPDSGGGQFFFLSQAAGSYLGDPQAIGDSAGSYVVFGRTTQGLDVLQKISDLESPAGSSTPSRPVTIESVTITES